MNLKSRMGPIRQSQVTRRLGGWCSLLYSASRFSCLGPSI